jgi:hypothetical protein
MELLKNYISTLDQSGIPYLSKTNKIYEWFIEYKTDIFDEVKYIEKTFYWNIFHVGIFYFDFENNKVLEKISDSVVLGQKRTFFAKNYRKILQNLCVIENKIYGVVSEFECAYLFNSQSLYYYTNNNNNYFETDELDGIKNTLIFFQNECVVNRNIAENQLIEKKETIKQEHSIEQEQNIQQEQTTEQEHSIEQEQPKEKEQTIEKEQPIVQEQNIQQEQTIEQEQPKEKEQTIKQEQTIEKEQSIEQEQPIEQELQIEQEQQIEQTEIKLNKENEINNNIMPKKKIIVGYHSSVRTEYVKKSEMNTMRVRYMDHICDQNIDFVGKVNTKLNILDLFKKIDGKIKKYTIDDFDKEIILYSFQYVQEEKEYNLLFDNERHLLLSHTEEMDFILNKVNDIPKILIDLVRTHIEEIYKENNIEFKKIITSKDTQLIENIYNHQDFLKFVSSKEFKSTNEKIQKYINNIDLSKVNVSVKTHDLNLKPMIYHMIVECISNFIENDEQVEYDIDVCIINQFEIYYSNIVKPLDEIVTRTILFH